MVARLAVSAAERDREFVNLTALAEHLHGVRGSRDIRVGPVELARPGGVEHGATVTDETGEWLGYVLINCDAQTTCSAVLTALIRTMPARAA